MSEIFYRVHWTECGPFSAERAYSSSSDMEISPDGAQVMCTCAVFGGPDEDCGDCGGTGWVDRDPGYSCCRSASQLADYMREHGWTHLAEQEGRRVVRFSGYLVGVGGDGEPLAVPDGEITEWLTWGELLARVAAGE